MDSTAGVAHPAVFDSPQTAGRDPAILLNIAGGPIQEKQIHENCFK
jgi:hypothetical protein